jgi:uracil-DNA glycosylase family 4
VSHWDSLNERIVACTLCPRLREHCARTATDKRAAFRQQEYWGKPVPNLGARTARLLIVGLAPAAHGANRTGRLFTGDRSGDFLFRAMHETGFVNQPDSVHAADGLKLIDAAITGVAHCAPPDNKPLPDELANCSTYLRETFDLMPQVVVVMALGGIAFDACLRIYRERGWMPPKTPKPRFGHGVVWRPSDSAPYLTASFHPSQQNTFTGRLTPAMMRDVFAGCRALIDEAAKAAQAGPNTPSRVDSPPRKRVQTS